MVNFINRYAWVYSMFFLGLTILYICSKIESESLSPIKKTIYNSFVLLGVVFFLISSVLMTYTNILFTYNILKYLSKEMTQK